MPVHNEGLLVPL